MIFITKLFVFLKNTGIFLIRKILKFHFLITLCFYILIFNLITSNLNILNFNLSNNKNLYFYEALLQPKTNYPVNYLFNVDPYLTSSDDPAVNRIHRKISSLIFSSLFKRGTNMELIGDLISKYEYIENYVISMQIKPNVYWHDNTILTVDDVIFSFEVLKAIGDKSKFVSAINGGDIKLEKLDDLNFKIYLVDTNNNPKPNSSYIESLDFPILPRHILINYSFNDILYISDTNFGKAPIGSGKFIYYKNKLNELELRRNLQYYDQINNFFYYILKFYNSLQKISYDLKLGYVDLFVYDTPWDENDYGLDYFLNKSSIIFFNKKYVLFFNLKRKDKNNFNNSVLVRRAFLKSLDRNIFNNKLKITYPLFAPVVQNSDYFLDSEQIKFNIDDSKNILKNLGFTKSEKYYVKNNNFLSFELTYFADEEVSVLIANSLKEYYEDYGILITLRPIGTFPIINKENITIQPSFKDILFNRDFDVLLLPVLNLIEPNLYDEWHSSRGNYPGLNFSNYISNTADLLLEESRKNFGDEKKKNIKNFLNIFYEEIPAIYLIFNGIILYYSNKLNDLKDLGDINMYSEYDIYNFI